MSAEDTLSQALFHGTTHAFKPGDIVEPRQSKFGHGAFATTDPGIAHAFGDDPERLERSGHLMGMVYEVEPVDKNEKLQVHGADDMLVSQKGFRVKKLHDMASWSKVIRP